MLFNRPEFHEPVVDGVRAIAVGWVLILHIVFFHFGAFPDRILEIFSSPSTQWIRQGVLGVDLFFVISGYLIGTILLKEYRKTNRINLRLFYARRFLRLTPVYVVVMCMGIYFLRNVPKSAILVDIAPSGNVEHAWTNLLYINNFVTVHKQYMVWCWSLAIEEQFYLIAPVFLLLVVGRSRRPLTWMLFLLLLSGFIRFAIIRAFDFVPPYNDRPDMHSWSLRFDVIYDKLHVRYGGLLAGVVGAYCSLFHREAVRRFFGDAGRATLTAISSLIVFGCVASTSFGAAWFESLPKPVSQLIDSHHRDLFSIGVLLIILVAIHGQGMLAATINRILSARVLYPISQLSYSIYLLHEMFMLWLFPKTTPILVQSFGLGPNGVLVVNGLGVSLLTVLTATLLYVGVERPCMELRKSRLLIRHLSRPEPEMVFQSYRSDGGLTLSTAHSNKGPEFMTGLITDCADAPIDVTH